MAGDGQVQPRASAGSGRWCAAGPWGLVHVEQARPTRVDWRIDVGDAAPVDVQASGDTYLVSPCSEAARGLVHRAVLAAHVGSQGGLVLHASAVVAPSGRATLFLGRSGSGKTTVSTQAVGALLGDDTIVLWRGRQGLEVVATPFVSEGGRAAEVDRGRPQAVCLLRWGASPRADPIDDQTVFRALVESVYRPSGQGLGLAATESLLELVGTTRAYRLTYPRAYRFDPAILSLPGSEP